MDTTLGRTSPATASAVPSGASATGWAGLTSRVIPSPPATEPSSPATPAPITPPIPPATSIATTRPSASSQDGPRPLFFCVLSRGGGSATVVGIAVVSPCPIGPGAGAPCCDQYGCGCWPPPAP